MNRWLAFALAVIGGAVAAFAMAIGFVAAVYGFLWIYVFGDDPWPTWVEPAMSVALLLFTLGVWLVVGRLIWRHFRRPAKGHV